LPSVNRLYQDLKQKGLEVLLVSFRESAALVKRTAAERGYVAPVLLDESGEVTGKLYGVWGPPTAYFVDRQGQLLGRLVGPHDWSAPAARKLVEALLAAPSAKR
jgi:peroxiredoxin